MRGEVEPRIVQIGAEETVETGKSRGEEVTEICHSFKLKMFTCVTVFKFFSERFCNNKRIFMPDFEMPAFLKNSRVGGVTQMITAFTANGSEGWNSMSSSSPLGLTAMGKTRNNPQKGTPEELAQARAEHKADCFSQCPVQLHSTKVCARLQLSRGHHAKGKSPAQTQG